MRKLVVDQGSNFTSWNWNLFYSDHFHWKINSLISSLLNIQIENPSVPHLILTHIRHFHRTVCRRAWRICLTDLCGTDGFVLNWRIYVELTCGTDGFWEWKEVALVWNWRIELMDVWNWRVPVHWVLKWGIPDFIKYSRTSK